ncbi:fungal-specific transcription factor domain-containing protein [Talaromyces proteolyticus]|uniref:Fungal-specific transcription factor domain-containing protein n=1 Tax=Talaromyces proteolyticus TaxID=1131652 RepID=A0AAD4Q6S8_9EURO|nr:fungal-specific transcription factor domain-containing protein [Talaromyces proteolyticus]KAH8705958.1 fungal-specific transcription factor domain-containing protein [Talaromyces proteolyticus]
MGRSASDSRRRDKPILSCAFCRGRKLRCDRQSPCSACIRRGKSAECIYNSTEQERKDAIDYRPHARGQQARQRIARLEKLVTEMRDMTQSSPRTLDSIPSPSASLNELQPPLVSSNDNVTENMGKLSLTDNHAVYIGSSHWATILEDIQNLKDDLSDEYPDDIAIKRLSSYDFDGMHDLSPPSISLLSSVACLPREEILAMIPPRKVVDRHISRFFNSFDFASVILHRKKFLAEYTNFWENPSSAPIMWIGLLFSIINTSAFLQQKQDIGGFGMSAVDFQDTPETYRTLTIHCLVAGNYLRPSNYTIETLILHFAMDQNVNIDTNIGNWVLIGVIIRVAMRMGLHRDPSHWPNIRPIHGELRRRIWIILYHMDFFTSTQVGLPRIIKDSQCDTRPPAHLVDDDPAFETGEIPPSRPLTDSTPLSHIIQRDSIIKITAEIYDTTEAAIPPSPATVAILSTKLEKAIDSIPACSRYNSLEASVTENPVTIMHRLFLDILIHKAVYLLHRRSFVKGSDAEEENPTSHELCITAALAILEHQQRMSEETQPGGLMFDIRWKVSSLNHEFLQATMMLCFALTRLDEDTDANTTKFSCALNRRDDIVEALNNAKYLWEKSSDWSVEAQKAAKAIKAVLKQDVDTSNLPNLETGYELFEQMPGGSSNLHLSSFDAQNMVLDPSFFAVDNDISTFGVC